MNRQKKIFLLVYYNRQIGDIYSFMKAIPGSYRLKDLHKLRVRIKRLKSIFRLLGYIYSSDFNAKDHYQLFKPVFKQAGLIRESQINLRLLGEAPCEGELCKSYSRYIARLRTGWEADLDKLIHTFSYAGLKDCNDRVRELLSRHTGSELVSFITGFIYSETDGIRNMLDGQEDLQYIHEVRIVMKNIKPLLALIWRRKDNIFTRSHYEHLNATETCIGDWHDHAVLLRSLTAFLNSAEKPDEKLNEEYIALQKELMVFSDEAFDKIRDSLSRTLKLFSR
ncbi:MAG TPA: CHAD domain-containing protein [Bacteroidetes bacterium]|nr:CHAD domain-containing protein [Bacteroidota bacterium]